MTKRRLFYRYLTRKFLGSTSGNIALSTALLTVPIMLAAGVSVDYTRLSAIHAQMQHAADSAAVAAAAVTEEMSDDELNTFVDNFFSANGATSQVTSVDEISARYRQTTVRVDAEYDASLYFLSPFRADNSKITVVSEATRTATGVELALVLDNTTSMSFGTTWQRTTEAVENVLEDIKSVTTNGEFYTTLIPYVDRVNIGTSRSDFLASPGSVRFQDFTNAGSDPERQEEEWENAMDDWDGCVEPLEDPVSGYPYNLALGDPRGSFVPSVREYWSGARARNNGNSSRCPHEIVGPTNDIDEIADVFEGLRPIPGTGRFDHALAWGWRAVAHQYQGEWGAGGDYPADPGDRKKIVALFTDAHTNINKYEMEQRNGEFGNNNGSQTLFSHVEQVCNRMKDEDITVFIFHVIGNGSATPYFENCAEENYFEIRGFPDFENALGELARVGTNVRLVK